MRQALGTLLPIFTTFPFTSFTCAAEVPCRVFLITVLAQLLSHLLQSLPASTERALAGFPWVWSCLVPVTSLAVKGHRE